MGGNERHSNRNLVRAFANALGKPIPKGVTRRDSHSVLTGEHGVNRPSARGFIEERFEGAN